ncbi:hypothetical protein MTR67_003414 [Solanum verrucosum]|uniref:Uncharacterized protein n=1 Tax=Solanum verrucosum TaxID=315347 RepID=A0AAF0T9N5_SOLVR|nr:hypothetical protein MTR67_003414 [Solanum verrucosum]
MHITCQDDFGISDENSVIAPPPVNREKINKGVNISKFKLKELNHYELLDEIFGKSIALGNHVVYSTMPVSQPTIDETTEVGDAIFYCDDNPVNTENVYQPMSVNINNDNGMESGLRVMYLFQLMVSHLLTVKKNRPTTIEGIFNDM